MRKTFVVLMAGIWLGQACMNATADQQSPVFPPDAEIRKLISQRIDGDYHDVTMVVGVIDPSGRRVISSGAGGDGDTVFEIGSITKTFTALLLADMVDKGEVTLEDPVQKFLPAQVKVPSHGGKQITLAELAMNTSGLPDNPLDVDPTNYSDFHAGYAASVDQLYGILGRYQLTLDPGAKAGHSNLGVGLLGHALALRASMDYEPLLKTRILKPLGMTDTAVTLTADMSHREAAGHDPYLRQGANIELGALAGAGALKSTANDMLKFLAAELGYGDNPLKQAMATQISAIRTPLGAVDQMALQVAISPGPVGDIVWTNGGTFGAQSFLGFDPTRRIGVVVLVNATGPHRLVDDIGLNLLTGSPVATVPPPQPPPPANREIAALTPDVLDRYVGFYHVTPQFTVTVTRSGNRLFAQLTGQAAYEIFPESQTKFFWKIVEAEATFNLGAGSRAESPTLHQGGQDILARRIAGGPN